MDVETAKIYMVLMGLLEIYDDHMDSGESEAKAGRALRESIEMVTASIEMEMAQIQ